MSAIRLTSPGPAHATKGIGKETERHESGWKLLEVANVVSRNVAALVDTPGGQEGRPSKSLTVVHWRSAERQMTDVGWRTI